MIVQISQSSIEANNANYASNGAGIAKQGE
jgi:hypothetical protein